MENWNPITQDNVSNDANKIRTRIASSLSRTSPSEIIVSNLIVNIFINNIIIVIIIIIIIIVIIIVINIINVLLLLLFSFFFTL